MLLKEARILTDKGRHLLALEKLGQIRSKHPYSYYATHAELLQADILFAQENYAEAAAAYIVFRDLHPKHDRTAYVLWMTGESYHNQLPGTFDRDLSPGVEAMKYYRELLAAFPRDERAGRARERIAFIEGQLALKERYIADFYFKTKDYGSARLRYLDILERFADEGLLSHAMDRVLAALHGLGRKDECLERFRSFRSRAAGEALEGLERRAAQCRAL